MVQGEHSQLKQAVDVRGDMRELGSTQGFSPVQNKHSFSYSD